jgi:DNA N-6-adenine-methyltransferase (Dam)
MNKSIANLNTAIIERRARKAAGDIHAASLAEDIAERVKDPTALEGALIRKLEAQRDFAAQYRGVFPHRGVMPIDASTGVNSTPAEWCLSFGFALRSVQRWCDLLDADKYADKQKAVVKKCWELAELWQAANFSSEHNEWYTPAKYIEAVREVLGDIDLDPASSAQANAVVRAGEIFTQFDDGLAREWRGRFFMNPPYGRTPEHRSLAGAFCNKAIEQFNAGNVEAGIVLVNSLHSQTWQAPLYDHTVCFVDHRIHFVSADGEENEAPTFQNIFVYLGQDAAKFAVVFSRFGYVMRKV